MHTLEDEGGTYGKWNLIGNPSHHILHIDDADQDNNFLTVNDDSFNDNYWGVYAWDGWISVVYNHLTDNITTAPREGSLFILKMVVLQ